MPQSNVEIVSKFIEGAPPGGVANVTKQIRALTSDEPNLLQEAEPAFEKHNEEQLTTVKLPGASQNVLVSKYNSLGDGWYYDVESSTSFQFDHINQKASAAQSYTVDSRHGDLIKSLLKSLSTHAAEHYHNATYSVFPTLEDRQVAVVLVANKYSPGNFWNGRFRTTYLLDASSLSGTGEIKVDVHYYEDGNVRLSASKELSINGSGGASDAIRQIALAEKKYQEELNKGFAALSEGSFKNLRRPLPVTRQKVEWEKIGGYRLGQDIGGGRGAAR